MTCDGKDEGKKTQTMMTMMKTTIKQINTTIFQKLSLLYSCSENKDETISFYHTRRHRHHHHHHPLPHLHTIAGGAALLNERLSDTLLCPRLSFFHESLKNSV